MLTTLEAKNQYCPTGLEQSVGAGPFLDYGAYSLHCSRDALDLQARTVYSQEVEKILLAQYMNYETKYLTLYRRHSRLERYCRISGLSLRGCRGGTSFDEMVRFWFRGRLYT